MADISVRKWLFIGGSALVGIAMIAGAIAAMMSFLQSGERPKQIVHNIALIKQPPPPPPKPPEKPPEPPKVKEEVKIPDPEQKPTDKPDDKPASDKPLALEGQGGPGSDGFGLAGRSGGTDLLATGGGGAYYTGLLQRQFYEALMRNRKIQRREFKVIVRVQLGSDGKVEHVELVNGSGNHDLDDQIQAALVEIPPMKEVPPASLREVDLRLSNHV